MIVWKYTKFHTEEPNDYIRYDDLANNNEIIKISGNSDYSDYYPFRTMLWEHYGGTSKIRFSFYSDGADEERGVSLKLSCLYPEIKA